MYGRTFGNVIDSLAIRSPRLSALADDTVELSYAETVERLRAIGGSLRGLGLGPGDRVAILMGNSIELALTMHGALWAGLTVVPLNVKLSVEDHSYMLADAEAKVLLYHQSTINQAVALADTSNLRNVFMVGGGAGEHPELSVAGVSTTALAPTDVNSEKEAYIQYTGGTTGLPKGVVHSHRTMLSTLFGCALEYDIAPGERHAHVAPLTHGGLATFFPVWLRGGCNVVLKGFDSDRLLNAIEHEKVTSTLLVPTMVNMLLEHPRLEKADLSSLRTLIYGAAPITASALDRALDAFGPVLVQGYGQTEVFSQITILNKTDHLAAATNKSLLTSAGRPVAIAEVRIADDSDQPVAAGEAGEVQVRGPHMFMHYLNKPEETAATQLGGWVHTGDVGWRDEDGYLHLVDRKKDMIISGGFNIYPKEIEMVLDEHPLTDEVCVVGMPDDKWGERVTAVIVSRPGTDRAALAEELTAMVRARKGSMLVPKSIEFVTAIPQTSVGKYDKAALKSQLMARS